MALLEFGAQFGVQMAFCFRKYKPFQAVDSSRQDNHDCCKSSDASESGSAPDKMLRSIKRPPKHFEELSNHRE